MTLAGPADNDTVAAEGQGRSPPRSPASVNLRREDNQAGTGPAREPPSAIDAPLRLHPEWLYHHLTIAGPPSALADFQAVSAGAGLIPWHLDLDRLQEDLFHRLVAPAGPEASGLLTAPPSQLSLTGARTLAAQLRAAVAQRHEQAIARVGHSRACPFDLHALLPVPAAVLRLGPDDPAADAWLWQHWGTCQALRHVTLEEISGAAAKSLRIKFWSADWSPWPAMKEIAAQWPALRFDLRPIYGDA